MTYMAGRPKKPTKLKLIEGSFVHRGLPREPKVGIGACPTHLSPLAKKQWKHLVHHLNALNLVTGVDRMLLEGLCVAYAQAVEADLVLSRLGLTCDHEDGFQLQRPEVSISHNCWLRVKEFSTELS